jgi:hypothetical protein
MPLRSFARLWHCVHVTDQSLVCPQARNQRHISDLDDGCLLQVLKRLTPLPDLFSVAATCKVSVPQHDALCVWFVQTRGSCYSK